MEELHILRLRKTARLPGRATAGSAGYDLYADLPAPLAIAPGECAMVGTGIAIALPGPHMAALVFGRSGLGVRHGIVPANAVGVVDSDYRGELLVGLRNQSGVPYTVQPGDRVAQLVLVPVCPAVLREVASLDETARGQGGFGASGR